MLFPMPCFPLLPPRGQSAVEFLLEGSRILGCPKRIPSTARPLSRGPWALIGLPFSVWTGACYWHGVGGSMFDSSSPLPPPAGQQQEQPTANTQTCPSRGKMFRYWDSQGRIWCVAAMQPKSRTPPAVVSVVVTLGCCAPPLGRVRSASFRFARPRSALLVTPRRSSALLSSARLR